MTNSIILTGRITKDLEIKEVGQNKVTHFSLAVDNPFKRDDTSFFHIEAWNRTADLLTEYCGKGSKILVEGSARQNTFTDKEGNNRERVVFNANRIEFLDSKSSSNQSKKDNPFSNGSKDIESELPF
ncbi:single-stranded DNA-binding protein [Staphylococcus equorum]|uniref:single-stranded DNA-binding protein n=1 Tax=Staphylococcus equorum TaxID=246432 RepID=UPI000267DDC4|nr:single-stranded DNA-binding protein [Staphylococcus equorum]MDG0825086.1 single-stranded DNA-binding protein [Staphylococcus equorum]MDK9857602.1 single-stranded DNA-binding protein [Staphylococcus equorum]MDK9874663.1 single-stranded DNA-binding protein [Staphylococcus equorum]UTT55182.1 single-stranded DNA-binding protein [Staphylococcus equorum]UTT55242.1 single-stranded DNA-binding protein [Staphylococcus equorum]